MLGKVCISVALLLCALPAAAHTSGASIEQVVNGYLVDIGYSPEVVSVDSPVRFDFSIFDAESGQEQLFTDIWVRIENTERLLFAGGIAKSRFGATGLSYSFGDPGEYTVFSRFSNASGTLVELTVPFTVPEPLQEKTWWGSVLSIMAPYFIIIPGILFLLALLYFGAKLLPSLSKNVRVPPRQSSLPKKSVNPYKEWGLHLVTILVFVAVGYYGASYVAHLRSNVPVSTTAEIVLTESGFTPSKVTIKKGTTVTFTNETGKPYWPASNLHPSHEIYPEFDPMRALESNESWSFTFERPGKWDMHDHIRSYFTGTITVIE